MGWETVASSLIAERNAVQCDSFLDIFSAFRTLEKKHRALKKKHIEIRNRIGVLQYEIQEAIYQKNTNLDEIKSKLSIIADDLSPRTEKEFDDIKVRFELSRRIKEQDHLIVDLKSEAETARSQVSKSMEEIVQLQEELKKRDTTNQVLRQELEGTRSYLNSAESRLKLVETENGQYAQRLVDEKNRNAQQMNEMNKLLQQAGIGPVSASTSAAGLLGGGINLMKRIGAGSFFGTTSSTPNHQDNDDDIEDDFVDLAGLKKVTVDEPRGDEEQRHVPIGECNPPRRAINFNKCHNSEINDLYYNREFFITGGSDSVVKIFERKGSGQSLDLTSAEIDEMPPQDARNSLTTNGPVISIDVKGGWIAAGCSDRIARIWSMTTGRLRHNLSGHANKVNSIRLVGTGEEKAVTGSADRILRIWDISRNQPQILNNLKVNSCINCVSISADCNTIVSGHQDGGLRFWNMNTKDKIHSIPKLHSTHITCALFDPRRNHLILTASRDNTLSVIDSRTYEPLLILRSPGFSLTSDWSQVAFSPDASYIAAGGANGSLYLWNAISGECAQPVPGHKAGIMSVYWGEFGVMSCDRQGGVVQWG